jgi:Leucine-rich repeat (LRR) protein
MLDQTVTPLRDKQSERWNYSRLIVAMVIFVLQGSNDACWPENVSRRLPSALPESSKRPAQQARSINFGDQFLGAVEVRRGKQILGSKPARGKIIVPSDSYVILKCGYEISGKPILTLKGLGPKDLQELDLSQSNVLGEDLSAIGKLYGLQVLSLSHTSIKDSGLRHLSRLAELKELFLCDTNVTDEGIEYLKSLSKLTCLQLSHTHITGRTLAQLSGLPYLRKLYLTQTDIADKDLGQLTSLPYLEELHFDKDKISDAGAQKLTNLTHLRILCLPGTEVTSKCMNYFKAMRQLHELDLSDTAVDDSAVPLLTQLPLTDLILINTKISKAGLQQLHARLRHCKITVQSPAALQFSGSDRRV